MYAHRMGCGSRALYCEFGRGVWGVAPVDGRSPTHSRSGSTQGQGDHQAVIKGTDGKPTSLQDMQRNLDAINATALMTELVQHSPEPVAVRAVRPAPWRSCPQPGPISFPVPLYRGMGRP